MDFVIFSNKYIFILFKLGFKTLAEMIILTQTLKNDIKNEMN